MKKFFLVLILGGLSGCGIVHNSIYPAKEHCLYRCYDEQLKDSKISSIENCDAREMALRMSLIACHIKCSSD